MNRGITLKQAISAFLQDYKTKLTKQYFNDHLRNLHRLEDFLGEINIADILKDKQKLTDFFHHLKEKYSFNPASLYYIILQMRNFLKFCVETKLITENVDVDEAIDYKFYTKEYQKHFKTLIPEAIYPFDEFEMRRYWIWQQPNIISLRNAIALNLLFDTGIKTYELLSIHKVNIDLLNNTIDLKGKNRRKIEISTMTSTLIGAYLAERRDDCSYLMINHSNDIPSRISPRSLERIVKYTSKSIHSLTDITMGMIRQSFIAKQFALGKKRVKVKDLAGYSHYHVPQLNKFSLHEKAVDNKPHKNVKRYLEDFETTSIIQDVYSLSDQKIDQIFFAPETDSKFISRTLLIRESQVQDFIGKVKSVYEGFIPVAVRQKEWGLSKDLFNVYADIKPESFKKVSRIEYITEDISREQFIKSLKTI